MERYRHRTGKRLTYASLAKLSGVGEGTLNSVGSRIGYNVTLKTVEKIRHTLDIPLHEFLELVDDPPDLEPEPSPKKTKKKKKKKTPKKKK